jgi:hypothetical protein
MIYFCFLIKPQTFLSGNLIVQGNPISIYYHKSVNQISFKIRFKSNNNTRLLLKIEQKSDNVIGTVIALLFI